MIQDLLTNTSEEAKLFRTYIRTYNNHFSFTSLGVKSDTNLTRRNMGIYTFRVQGQVYHFINDLQPQEMGAKNLQLYFHDTENEIENRITSTPRLTKDLIAKCITYLDHNPYARFFRNLRNIQSIEDYTIILKTIPRQDQQVYNKPEVSQVAAIWVEGEQYGEQGKRNIQVRTHSDQSRSVEYYYGCYDPLQYPLMFLLGELGWHQNIPKQSATKQMNQGGVTCVASQHIAPLANSNVDDLLNNEETGTK